MADLILNTLDEAKQHIFEVVVRGLSGQKWKQAKSNNKRVADCVWVAADGCKCAIGHLLQDPPPMSIMGNQSMSSALEYMPIELKRLRAKLSSNEQQEYLWFLQALLVSHDASVGPPHMLDCFIQLGVNHKLKWPEDVPVTL